jgi:RNA recognition motif-containing protein
MNNSATIAKGVEPNKVDSNQSTNNNNTSNNNLQPQPQQQQQQQQQQPHVTNNQANLIVNYLPQSLKEQDFNLLFSKIGPLKACKLMFDRSTGYSFGYGFVEYVNEEDARKSIETFNGYQIEHKRLKVALARPNCEETKNTNLYIRNIPLSYDEQQIHDLFSQWGEVVQVRLLRDQTTAFSRRIGFVIMSTKQMAQVAIQNLDNTVPPNGGTEPIYVKYADEEGKKRNGPQSMNAQMGNGVGGMNNQNFAGRNQNHQNNYNNSNNNYMNQHQQQQHNNNGFGGGGFGNMNMNMNNMMNNNNNQNLANNLSINSLQNLGKMKTNRSGGHQNRYNPIGGTGGLNQGIGGGNGINGFNNNGGNNNSGNNLNWNMSMAAAAAALQQQQQQSYSNFGASNNALGAAGGGGNAGFDSLMSTMGGSGGGNGGGGGYGNHHNNMHHQGGGNMGHQGGGNMSHQQSHLNSKVITKPKNKPKLNRNTIETVKGTAKCWAY